MQLLKSHLHEIPLARKLLPRYVFNGFINCQQHACIMHTRSFILAIYVHANCMHDLVRVDMHPKYLGFGLRPLSERRGLSTPPP
jgi:hypothetical protein